MKSETRCVDEFDLSRQSRPHNSNDPERTTLRGGHSYGARVNTVGAARVGSTMCELVRKAWRRNATGRPFQHARSK